MEEPIIYRYWSLFYFATVMGLTPIAWVIRWGYEQTSPWLALLGLPLITALMILIQESKRLEDKYKELNGE